MIVAEDKKIKKCPVSLQPDIENLLQDLSPDDRIPVFICLCGPASDPIWL